MERLIAAVRRYPCLWNTTAIEYRDQELKEAAWAEVVKETDLPSVKEVKMKWKKLRDSYRDALKRQGEPGQARKGYAWKYSALMHFLQPHMSNRKKPAAAPPALGPPALGPPALSPPAPGEPAPEPPEPPSSDDSDSSADGEPKRKAAERLELLERRLDLLAQRRKRPAPPAAAYPAYPAAPDSLDVFFSSMCQSTKRLPYPTQIKIKRLVFEAVIEAEEKLIAEQQTYASLWAARGASSSSSEPS